MNKTTKQMNKKGVVGGLDVVGKVLVAFLVLAVIAIASFLALNSLDSSSILSATKTIGSDGSLRFINSTINLNATGSLPPAVSNIGFIAITYTGAELYNKSSGELIDSPNYTVVNGRFFNVTNEYGNRDVNVTVTYYTYTVNGDQRQIIGNVTEGTTKFFNNTPTIFVILGAVIIILAVTLILYAVYRFSGSNIGGTGSEL